MGMFRFLNQALSEPGVGGTPSASRLVMFVFAVAAVAWVSYIVFHTRVVPDLWHIAAFVSSPYLVNKGSATLETFKK